MDLIYFNGLNCHIASVINIANLLGIDYFLAFATLWSENDFTDEKLYNIYESKRVYKNLEGLGLTPQRLDCDKLRENIFQSPKCAPIDIKDPLPQIQNGELLVIGMDIFQIPWHPVYSHFHDSHYFFARKETANSFICYDPIYNAHNERLSPHEIIPTAFELTLYPDLLEKPNKISTEKELSKNIFTIYPAQPEKEKTSLAKALLKQEASDILRTHKKTIKNLTNELEKCRSLKRHISILLKRVTAMINNRYMFAHFVQKINTKITDAPTEFFDAKYFIKWEGVKNGLYKCQIVKDNTATITEVEKLLKNLMKEELNIADKILKSY